jgi:hypothetical protein
MSYHEENDQVILTMSRDDYDIILLTLGYALGAALQGQGPLGERVIVPLINRLNEGNPNFTPYHVKKAKP